MGTVNIVRDRGAIAEQFGAGGREKNRKTKRRMDQDMPPSNRHGAPVGMC
jgi:hypothetical protein